MPEHLTTNHNAVTLDPLLPVSFVTAGGAADGRQAAALGAGPSDGFEKIIAYAPALPGCVLRVLSRWDISEDGGALRLCWNAQASAWWLVGGVGYTAAV